MAHRSRSPAAHDLVMGPVERLGFGRQRALAVAAATGRVVDVGAGTGLGLAHYRPGVRVLACEPDATRRHRLARRAATAPVPVRVVAARLPELPFADRSFDTVVCALVLCSVADEPAALAELRRVLAADGQLLFLEHGPARSHAIAALQRGLAPTWARVASGCRLDRDPIGGLRAAGFVVSECQRLEPLGRATSGVLIRGRAIAGGTAP
jgi:SAM-dependent methyltransferase